MENLHNVWAVELDILNKFMDDCSKYNLQYSAGIQLHVPKGYDKIMSSQYGVDYMNRKHVPTDHGETFLIQKILMQIILAGKLKIPYEWTKACQNQ
jgi:hypothetical protein